MKLLPKLFRRSKPITRQEGIASINSAVKNTLNRGLKGFVFSALHEAGSDHVEVVIAAQGDFSDSLAHVLGTLLARPETKDAARVVIITALQKNGGARFVQVAPIMGCGDPDCPVCTLQRQGDERSQTQGKPH